jgi:hypothetical protein
MEESAVARRILPATRPCFPGMVTAVGARTKVAAVLYHTISLASKFYQEQVRITNLVPVGYTRREVLLHVVTHYLALF